LQPNRLLLTALTALHHLDHFLNPSDQCDA